MIVNKDKPQRLTGRQGTPSREPQQHATHSFTCIMPHMKLYSWNVNGIRAVHKKGPFSGVSCRPTGPISCVCRRPRPSAGRSKSICRTIANIGTRRPRRAIPARRYSPSASRLRVINGFPRDFAQRYTFADELRARQRRRGPADHGRVRRVLRGDGVHAERQGRPQPLDAALQALGSRIPRLLPAARAQPSP